MRSSSLATAVLGASCIVPNGTTAPEPPASPGTTTNILDTPIENVTFVVTRYKEDLTPWADMANRTYLYDKFGTPQSADNVSHASFLQYSVVPNVGHEQSTICLHVYENYDNLSDVVVFAQASPFTNLLSPAVNTTTQMLEIAAQQAPDPAWAPAIVFNHELVTDLQQWSRVNWSAPEEAYWISQSELTTLTPAPYTMGDYWLYLFGRPHPPVLRAHHGGTFGATREALRRRPKAFWGRCMAAFGSCGQNSSDDELGFFMERMDLALLDDEKFSLEQIYVVQGQPALGRFPMA